MTDCCYSMYSSLIMVMCVVGQGVYHVLYPTVQEQYKCSISF